MKARHWCAVLGVAAAVGAVVFMKSLVASNDAQAPRLAESLLKSVPVEKGARVARMALDYRPGGHVMQGPPMSAVVATRGGVEGVAVTRALFAQRRLPAPSVGSDLTLVGEKGAYTLKISEVIDWSRPASRAAPYPNAFVSPETAAKIGEEWTPFTPPSVDDLAPGFVTDEGRNIDKSKVLLLWAAALTALGLLVNTLLLSVEARRREIALLRVVGMTRCGVVARVFAEALLLSAVGLALGSAVASAAIYAYAAFESSVFPAGAAVSCQSVAICAAAMPLLAIVSTLIAMKSALSVRPLEAASLMPPRSRHVGMIVSFAFGFGAFVAVEVWGSSLMSAFVPSPEWPDAIVSILPKGASSFDIDKLRGIEGVRHIAELQPLQVNFDPLEELKMFGGRRPPAPEKKGTDPALTAPGPEKKGFDAAPTAAGPEKKGSDAAPTVPRGERNGARPAGRGGPGGRPDMGGNRPDSGRERPVGMGGGRPGGMGRGFRGSPRKAYRNALLLASDYLPDFRFVEGGRDEAQKAIASSDACIITEMMGRARSLHLGDFVQIDCGRGLKMQLKVVGVVALNWHMVTSRGLLRGMGGMPGHTDGPVFVSFDTLAAADPRPQQHVPMTHLWLDYDPGFLAQHGAFEAGRKVESAIAAALGDGCRAGDAGEVVGNAVRLHSRDEISDGTFAHGNSIIGAMAKVPFIFVAVMAIGLVAMLVASADARRREFAVLRAVGATRSYLASRLAAEAVRTSLAGIALGLVGGAPVGWLFTFATRKAMANWGLPASFAVPWTEIAIGALSALAFALAVAVPASIAIVSRKRQIA